MPLFKKGDLVVRADPKSVSTQALLSKGFTLSPCIVWQVVFDPALKPHPQRIRVARFNETKSRIEVWHNNKDAWLPCDPDPDEGWFLAKYFVPYPLGGGN